MLAPFKFEGGFLLKYGSKAISIDSSKKETVPTISCIEHWYHNLYFTQLNSALPPTQLCDYRALLLSHLVYEPHGVG